MQQQGSGHADGGIELDVSTLRDDSGTRYYGLRVDSREVCFVDVAKAMESFRTIVGDAVNGWRNRRVAGLEAPQSAIGEVSQSH